ncbi:MAG: phosphotransferase [Proteobacteria bacterium]|nr:phosphotransferase [Pseudomonadota bacterium]
MNTDRAAALAAFLERAGWGAAMRAPLPGDASFRRYVRLTRGGDSAMLMDAPPPQEDVRPYLAIARLLLDLGYSAPAILAEDAGHGFLLIEDFGDRTYTRAFAEGVAEAPLYEGAVDLLIDLHRQNLGNRLADVPPYDDALLSRELGLFPEWWACRQLAHGDAFAAEYHGHWAALLGKVRAVPETLVLRDYHVDNLMVLDRPNIRRIGLLDFQDAVRGPVAYDLVSLVHDARRDVPPALARRMIARYHAAFPALDRAAFDAACSILSAQRNLKIIGIFTRLAARDGKPGYLGHIPRVWRLLENDLAHPALAGFRAWLDDRVPATARGAPVIAARATASA